MKTGLIFAITSLVLCGTVKLHASPELVDSSTLRGKVMCGYQGWFNCQGDGAELGWKHWGRGACEPGNVTVDLWPDVSEMDADELYATGFKLADGSVAKVFSSYHEKTVVRHFKWMEEYGIDGAFMQRFANGLKNEKLLAHKNAVLAHARKGAEQSGRVYAVMYDLSGLKQGQVERVREDWKMLRSTLELTKDRGYLKHGGKPLVAIWGVGFDSDQRPYSLKECRRLIEFLKEDGCAVMLGIPTFFREQRRDAINDPELHGVLELADVLSPWTVGRYRTPEQATRHGERVWKADLDWCSQRNLDFLPVVFPGFSWHNLKDGEPLNAIPRLKGKFLWSQFEAASRAGCEMVYVAMFDEVDEGTAIFKCTNNIPVGKGVGFVDYEGLPSDHYLRLTGKGAKLIREGIGRK